MPRRATFPFGSEKRAATSAKSFLQLCGFAAVGLEIDGIDDVTSSERLQGVVQKAFNTKRLTEKARPPEVVEVPSG